MDRAPFLMMRVLVFGGVSNDFDARPGKQWAWLSRSGGWEQAGPIRIASIDAFGQRFPPPCSSQEHQLRKLAKLSEAAGVQRRQRRRQTTFVSVAGEHLRYDGEQDCANSGLPPHPLKPSLGNGHGTRGGLRLIEENFRRR